MRNKFLSILFGVAALVGVAALITHAQNGTIVPANVGYVVTRTVVTNAYQILVSDHYVEVAATATNTLPAISGTRSGQVIMVGNPKPATYTVTVAPSGSDTIGNVAGKLTVSTTSSLVLLISDGVSNWTCVRPGT